MIFIYKENGFVIGTEGTLHFHSLWQSGIDTVPLDMASLFLRVLRECVMNWALVMLTFVAL